MRRFALTYVQRACVAVLLMGIGPCMGQSAPPQHGMTLDDLFQLSVLSDVASSPDGDWLAAVIIRPALPGEVYGRTFYEMDTTRADIWLISRRTGERRNITQGAGDASGFWCATWSPDGRRLAMLSTKAEQGEPRGGDNARLYVWDSRQQSLNRLSPRAMMTQTFGGSAMYEVHMQGPHSDGVANCSKEEHAPFMWLNNKELLALMLPPGSTSGLLDAYSRGLKHAGATLDSLRAGVEPTGTAVESGIETNSGMTALLQLVDVENDTARQVTTIPIYPFDGSLEITIAPDRHSAALLASIGAIQHTAGQHFAYPFAAWGVNKKLGFVALAAGSAVRWVESIPADGRYILDMPGWAPDSSAVAIRGRSSPATLTQSLFVVAARDLAVKRVSPEGISVAASAAGSEVGEEPTVMWVDNRRLVASTVKVADELAPFAWYKKEIRGEAMPRIDWWIFSRDAAAQNMTGAWPSVPGRLQPLAGKAGSGHFLGIADDTLWAFDIHSRKAKALSSQPLPAGAEVIWPHVPSAAMNDKQEFLIAGKAKDGVRPLLKAVVLKDTAQITSVPLPGPRAQFEKYAPAHSSLLFSEQAQTGTFLWATDAAGNNSRTLLTLNQTLAAVANSKTMLIDYHGSDGDALKAGVILPPDYQPGRRYPVLLWVYAGATVRDFGSDFFEFYQPGMYNMYLYAARGYVVMMPSMPLDHNSVKNDDYMELPKGVMPAIDRLIELGIGDANRLAVMGQSYGGYSTYSLVTYTNRFKAAIAMAGITNLVSDYAQFDTTARSYPGIEHQKSANAGLDELGQIGMGVAPYEDLWHYLRNSPLYFADRVNTPLLLIHGEQDIRGPMTQAEEFFYALYRQGKRAKLLRYWGEDHGLRLSPANVRDIVEQIFDWLKINMPEESAAPSQASSAQ